VKSSLFIPHMSDKELIQKFYHGCYKISKCKNFLTCVAVMMFLFIFTQIQKIIYHVHYTMKEKMKMNKNVLSIYKTNMIILLMKNPGRRILYRIRSDLVGSDHSTESYRNLGCGSINGSDGKILFSYFSMN
jgi:hypothetical protein